MLIATVALNYGRGRGVTDIKKGDYVIARSKHNGTVIEGEVINVDIRYGSVSVRPTGRRWSNGVYRSDFTFEVVAPPIKFGDGAVVRLMSMGSGVLVRGYDGHWFVPGVSIPVHSEEWIINAIHNGEATLLYPGYFPEEDA